jgi:ankyrin repeat protein
MKIKVELSEIVNINESKIFIHPIKEAIDNDDYAQLNIKLENKDITNERIPVSLCGEEKYLNLLHYCAFKGSINCLKYLVEKKGVDIKLRNENNSNLLHFLSDDSVEVLKYCIEEKKLNINIKNKFHNTPLLRAINDVQFKIMRYLIELGANVNQIYKEGALPLHFAADRNIHKAVEVLIAGGANINHQDKKGFTALHMGALNGSLESVEVLLKHQAEKNVRIKSSNITPLICAAYSGHTEIVKMLINAGAMRDISSKEGWYAIHFAAANGHSEICKLIKKQGSYSYIDEHTHNGNTPLYLAAQNGFTDTVKTLIDLGATLDLPNKGNYTPLDIAIINNHLSVMQILLDHGAQGGKDYNEDPISTAIQEKNIEAVKLLIMRGFNKNSFISEPQEIKDLITIGNICNEMLKGGNPCYELLKLQIKLFDKTFIGTFYDALYMRLSNNILQDFKREGLSIFSTYMLNITTSKHLLEKHFKFPLLSNILKSIINKSLSDIIEYYKINGLPIKMTYNLFDTAIKDILELADTLDLMEQDTKVYFTKTLANCLADSDDLKEFIFIELLQLPKTNSATSSYFQNYLSEEYKKLYHMFDSSANKTAKETLIISYNSIIQNDNNINKANLNKTWNEFIDEAAKIYEWDKDFSDKIKQLNMIEADSDFTADDKKQMIKMALMFHSLFPEYDNIENLLCDHEYLSMFYKFILDKKSPKCVVEKFVNLLSDSLLQNNIKTKVITLLNNTEPTSGILNDNEHNKEICGFKLPEQKVEFVGEIIIDQS